MKKSVLIAAVLFLTVSSFIFGQGVIPTPNFETWATHGTLTTWQEPVGWKSIDSFAVQLSAPAPVTKDSINPHSGLYDIQLQTKKFFGLIWYRHKVFLIVQSLLTQIMKQFNLHISNLMSLFKIIMA